MIQRLEAKYLIIFSIILLMVCDTFNVSAQAGIYSESEIDIQTMFIDATLEKQKANVDKQIEILKEIIKRDRSSHAAQYELAKAFYRIKDYEAAEKHALKAIQLDPGNEWYSISLADTYEKSDQHQKAINTYSKLIGINPKNDVFYHRMAMNQLSLGNVKDAAATLIKLKDKLGISEQTSKRLFDIYDKSDQKQEALQVLIEISNRYPENIRYLNNLAGYQKKLNLIPEAILSYEKVLKLEKDNPKANLELNRLNTKSEGGELSSVIELFKNSNVKLDDKIKSLMPFMANMKKGDQNIKTLLQLSKSLVQDYPSEAKAYAVRADVLFYSGDFNNSEKAYVQAINLDDRKYSLWDQRMVNLWELENYKLLEQTSMKAIDLFPNQVDAFIFQSLALSKNNNKDEANEYIEEAKFISGGNKEYLNSVNLIEAWININSWEPAVLKAKINVIESQMFSNPIYFECLGDLYKQISDSTKSKANWEKAIGYGANEKRLNKKLGA